jgi:hypothetical protein
MPIRKRIKKQRDLKNKKTKARRNKNEPRIYQVYKKPQQKEHHRFSEPQ